MPYATVTQLPDHNFPQPPAKPDSSRPQFDGEAIPSLLEIVDRAIQRDREQTPPELGRCEYTEPESYFGACDGGMPCCYQAATVTHLEHERDYCARHFEVGQ